jgi:DNA primase
VISPDTLARIKERTDIVALIGETVRLTRRGRSFVGLCPFHKEKSPSFHVHPERGFFHCFGCQESGSAIDFVMKTNGLDFLEAVRMLADRSGIVLEESVNAEASRAQKSEKDELYAVMMLAATYYERCLGLAGASALGGRAHPLAGYALRELDKRGMPSPGSQGPEAEHWQKAAAAFRLGYAPPGWDGLARFLREQGISAGVGERAGLLVAGQRGHYDRFRHRLMFAVVDALGRVIAFSGRALAAPDPEELKRHEPSAPSYDGEPPAKYINSPESPIYKKGEQLFGLFQAKAALRQRQEALLVEGNFDVVTLHAAGIEHAIAPLGTAFTAEQAKLIKRFAPSVVVLFDGDAAGKKATRAARIPCREGGLDARVATLPAGMDPDELVRTQGAAALLARLKEAKGMLEHLIQDALDDDRFQGAGGDGAGGAREGGREAAHRGARSQPEAAGEAARRRAVEQAHRARRADPRPHPARADGRLGPPHARACGASRRRPPAGRPAHHRAALRPGDPRRRARFPRAALRPRRNGRALAHRGRRCARRRRVEAQNPGLDGTRGFHRKDS